MRPAPRPRDAPGGRRPLQHRVLLMLTDGLAGDQQEIVRGAYGVARGRASRSSAAAPATT